MDFNQWISMAILKIRCNECDIDLTEHLQEIIREDQLNDSDGKDYIPRGYYFISDGDCYAGSEKKIIINKSDLINARNHSNPARLNGCCGLDGTHGLNKLCVNGHEIATEKSDCWMPHAIIFERELTTVVTE
jgi:hypothetical protein